MRIAHIDTEKGWRGGQQQAYSLIRGLESLGHETIAVVRGNEPLAEKLRTTHKKVYEVSPVGEFDLWTAYRVRRWLKQNQVDIVHAHNAHAVTTAALAVWNTSIPFVLTRRVNFPVGQNPLSKWKYRTAAHIICVTEDIQQRLISDGYSENHLTVIHSGVDFSRFENVKPVPKSEFGFGDDTFIVGQMAALAPHKDQKTFIRAVGHLVPQYPELRAVIVGEGPSRNELEAEIARLHLKPFVRLIGFRENPLPYVKAFDVFCISSNEEGICMAVVEAMILGVPVVATRVGGIPEIVKNGETGTLVDPANSSMLADALKSVRGNPGLARKMAEAAKINVDQFSVKHTVDRCVEVYKRVLTSLRQK